MNTSFGAGDGLQKLQRVADDSRYESAAFAKLPELVAIDLNSSLIMHELGNVLDKEKNNG